MKFEDVAATGASVEYLEKWISDPSNYPDSFEGDCQRTADSQKLRTIRAMESLNGRKS